MSKSKMSKTNHKVQNGKVRGTPVLTTAMNVINDIKKTVEESETITIDGSNDSASYWLACIALWEERKLK